MTEQSKLPRHPPSISFSIMHQNDFSLGKGNKLKLSADDFACENESSETEYSSDSDWSEDDSETFEVKGGDEEEHEEETCNRANMKSWIQTQDFTETFATITTNAISKAKNSRKQNKSRHNPQKVFGPMEGNGHKKTLSQGDFLTNYFSQCRKPWIKQDFNTTINTADSHQQKSFGPRVSKHKRALSQEDYLMKFSQGRKSWIDL